jgi:DHA2 family methylenomycin A resistance protein-like MFS transporter
VVVAGYFLVMLDTTIVNIALPHLGVELSTAQSALAWVVDAYTLVFAALLLPAGGACDRFGPRRVYLVGIIVFAVASIGCALAPTAGLLIAARAVQGIGAAAIVPATLALLTELFADPPARAIAVGLWGAAGGVAAAVGPLLGGLLLDSVSWRAVFWVNVPVVATIAIGALRVLPASAGRPRRLDAAGQMLAILTLAAFTFAVIDTGDHGLTLRGIAGSMVGIVAASVFVWRERRAPAPMLPLSIFSAPGFSTATLVGFVLNFSFFGQLFALTFYIQQTRDLAPGMAGLVMAPQALGAIIGAPLGGRITARTTAQRAMLTGLATGTAGFASLMVFDTGTPYAIIAILTFVAGLGMAIAMPAATNAAVSAAPEAYTGIAGSVVNASRQTGTVVGVALLGSIATGLGGIPGFRVAALGAAIAFALGLLLVTWDTCRKARDLTMSTRSHDESRTPWGSKSSHVQIG